MEREERGDGIGEIVRKRREAAGYSQKQLAAETLVAVRTIIRAEQGRPLKSENLQAICSVLGIDPASLPGVADSPVGEEPPGAGPDRPFERRRTFSSRTAAFFGPSMVRRLAALTLLVAVGIVSADAGFDRRLRELQDRITPEIVAASDLVMARSMAQQINYVVQDRAGRTNLVPASAIVDQLVSRQSLDSHCGLGGGCVDATLKNSSAYRDSDGNFRMTFGPVSQRIVRNAAGMISRMEGVAVRVAVTLRRSYYQEGSGLLWFDPRGISPSQIPGFEGGTSYLQVRIGAETLR